MKSFKTLAALLISTGIFCSCEDEIRNIAVGNPTDDNAEQLSSVVNPVDITVDGFDLLEKMQGDWTGVNRVIADDWDWFAFDYRPISPSHIYGIFEGGSSGNLMTSFFITDYMNTRTIMARNGGLLNGIYRSSYFVMDSVSSSDNGKYYRLIDAVGGSATMYMELRFVGDSLYFNAYTSRLGLNSVPTRHMTFRASKSYPELATSAASVVGFPQNIPAWDFSEGFDENFLYVNDGDTKAKSASFLAFEENSSDVFQLASDAGDPFKIGDHPYLGFLQVDIIRNSEISDDRLFVYLSRDALTDSEGSLLDDAFGSVLKFPELIGSVDQFLFTYLHPGNYYITVIADDNDDGSISEGDITSVSQRLIIDPEGQHQITINNINIRN